MGLMEDRGFSGLLDTGEGVGLGLVNVNVIKFVFLLTGGNLSNQLHCFDLIFLSCLM